MPIGTCLKAFTYRQFLLWRTIKQLEWNDPSKTDHYLMRIAQRVQQVLSKNPNAIRLDSQRIQFNFKQQQSTSMDSNESIAASKSIWKARLGIK